MAMLNNQRVHVPTWPFCFVSHPEFKALKVSDMTVENCGRYHLDEKLSGNPWKQRLSIQIPNKPSKSGDELIIQQSNQLINYGIISLNPPATF